MKIKVTMLILCTVLVACKKSDNLVLTTNLTGCPINTTCSYRYFDNADFDTWQLVSGNYRAFLYESTISGRTTSIYFKTPLGSSQFVITSQQIASGQLVAYNFICPICNYLLQQPIGGEIKGRRTDATHWLVNASIIWGTDSKTPLDTLVVNQYFVLQKLP